MCRHYVSKEFDQIFEGRSATLKNLSGTSKMDGDARRGRGGPS